MRRKRASPFARIGLYCANVMYVYPLFVDGLPLAVDVRLPLETKPELARKTRRGMGMQKFCTVATLSDR